MVFTKDTKLRELLDNEETKVILTDSGVPCASCPFARMELDILTLGEICESYDIDLEKLLGNLNKMK